jgi:hypothetical protein
MASFKLNKKDIKDIYRKCLYLVRNEPPEFFVLRKLRGVHGMCNWTDLEFGTRGELLSTGYHECIHYIFPDWSETMVLYAESRVINNVSIFDNARFLKNLVDKIYKSALQQSLSDSRKKRARKKKKTNTNVSRNKRR